MKLKKIAVFYNILGLEYDIYGLVKAFCPKYIVKTVYIEDDKFEFGDFDVNLSVIKNYNQIKISCNSRLCSYNEKMYFDYDEKDDKLSFKNQIKIAFYIFLSKMYQKKLPWGTLTGIRPIKLVSDILRKIKDPIVAFDFIKQNYLISDEKINLSIDISKRQQSILKRYDDKCKSLYISIPFCKTICNYCSFPSDVYSRSALFIEDYIKCICAEIKYICNNFGNNFTSIYIGGGTPSILEKKYLKWLLDTIARYCNLSKCDEITFEAGRPDSINDELFMILKNYPINRISINPQTMNDDILKAIGRLHTSDDIYKAFDTSIQNGFDNINSDIILGLPHEDEDSVKNTLKKLLDLPIKALTVHNLSIKKGSKLRENLNHYNYIDDKKIEVLNNLCVEYTKNKNMYPYYLYRQKDIAGNLENIGYCIKDYEGIYNILILEENHSILGVGAGAVSKIVNNTIINRVPNIKDARLYIQRFNEMLKRKGKYGQKLCE